jgi:hypothetical protein
LGVLGLDSEQSEKISVISLDGMLFNGIVHGRGQLDKVVVSFFWNVDESSQSGVDGDQAHEGQE